MYLSTQVLRSTLRFLNMAQHILASKEVSCVIKVNKEQNDLCDSILLLEYDICSSIRNPLNVILHLSTF